MIGEDNNLIYEYTLQKFAGMTPEESVLLALAFDFDSGMARSPLFDMKINEIAVMEQKVGHETALRILVVLAADLTVKTTGTAGRAS